MTASSLERRYMGWYGMRGLRREDSANEAGHVCTRVLWVPAVLLAVVGCSEVGPPDSAPLILVLSSVDAPDDPGVPLAGVRLCQTDTSNCATSDATGKVTINLPIDEETSYTLEREGHASYLGSQILREDGLQYAFGMATNEQMAEQFRGIMSAYPMQLTGTITLSIGPPLAGATFELVDATGKGFYRDESGWWSLDFTETTSQGSGGFSEISAGEFQINLGGAAQSCVTGLSGWPGRVTNSVRFPIRAGYISWASVNCPR